jgi:YbbR domain-containing protein
MQQKPLTLRQTVLSNLFWFLASLVLAFAVWMVAVAQRDPIEERRLPERATIQFIVDDAMVITDSSSQNAVLRARGQRSAVSLLTTEDVTVTADLRGLPPGVHPVTLETIVQRERVLVDTIPRQVNVTLELLETRLVPVRVELVGELPPGYARDQAQFDTLEVAIGGAASLVAQVDAAAIRLDLTEQRSTLTETARLVAVNIDGEPVANVTVNPQVVTVNLPIRQRPDVREVSVQPNLIGADELPEGYVFTSLTYEPRIVLVSGPIALLETLPETFFTAPIELTDRTGTFEIQVPVELPSRDLVIISGQTITVTIGITAQTDSRQFDGIAIEIIGLGEGLQAQLTPDEVSLLITGPLPALADLRARDVRVIVDLNNLQAGDYILTPQPILAQGLPEGVMISVLPETINVRISELAN